MTTRVSGITPEYSDKLSVAEPSDLHEHYAAIRQELTHEIKESGEDVTEEKIFELAMSRGISYATALVVALVIR